MKFRRAIGDLVEVYKNIKFYDKSAVAHRFHDSLCIYIKRITMPSESGKWNKSHYLKITT